MLRAEQQSLVKLQYPRESDINPLIFPIAYLTVCSDWESQRDQEEKPPNGSRHNEKIPKALLRDIHLSKAQGTELPPPETRVLLLGTFTGHSLESSS